MSVKNSDLKLIRRWCKVQGMDYKSAKKVWKNSDERRKSKFRTQIIKEISLSEKPRKFKLTAGKE